MWYARIYPINNYLGEDDIMDIVKISNRKILIGELSILS